MLKKLIPVLIFALSAFAGMVAVKAATDGTLGTTSTGTSVITLIVPEQFRITSVSDFSFGTYSGSGTFAANDDICVYSNGDGTYSVTITDGNGASGYNVYGPLANIPMTVYWNGTTGTTGRTTLSKGVAANFTGANQVSTNCASGGLRANLSVSMTQADLQAARSGAHTATLTVLIQPN